MDNGQYPTTQQGLAALPATSLRGLHTHLARLIKAMRFKAPDARAALLSEME